MGSKGPVSIRGVHLAPRTFVDLILKNAGGQVLDWYAAATPRATKTRIVAVTLDKPFYDKSEPVQGVVTLTSQTGGHTSWLCIWATTGDGAWFAMRSLSRSRNRSPHRCASSCRFRNRRAAC